MIMTESLQYTDWPDLSLEITGIDLTTITTWTQNLEFECSYSPKEKHGIVTRIGMRGHLEDKPEDLC